MITDANANSRWRFEYDIADIGGLFTNASGTYTTLSTVTVPMPASVNSHVLASFGDLPMTGFKESAGILWKISRLANSDAVDDCPDSILLLEFDIHYRISRRGTVPEF
jgi:hypothetical protein